MPLFLDMNFDYLAHFHLSFLLFLHLFLIQIGFFLGTSHLSCKDKIWCLPWNDSDAKTWRVCSSIRRRLKLYVEYARLSRLDKRGNKVTLVLDVIHALRVNLKHLTILLRETNRPRFQSKELNWALKRWKKRFKVDKIFLYLNQYWNTLTQA